MDATLSLLLTEVRSRTLRLLADVTDEQARFTGNPGLNNHLVWHAGHNFVVLEVLGVSPALTQPPAYPAGWFEMFGKDSQPANVKDWPALSDIRRLLEDQFNRLNAVLASLHVERLDQVIDIPKNRTLRGSIVHALLDESRHQGEIMLLKKLWAKRVVV